MLTPHYKKEAREGLGLQLMFLCSIEPLAGFVLCHGTSPNPARLVCLLGDVWKHVPFRDTDSAVSLVLINPPGQPPLSHPITKSCTPTQEYKVFAKQEVITPLELVNFSSCSASGAQRNGLWSRQQNTTEQELRKCHPINHKREASSPDGRCLSAWDNQLVLPCACLCLTQSQSSAHGGITQFGKPPSFFSFLLLFPMK